MGGSPGLCGITVKVRVGRGGWVVVVRGVVGGGGATVELVGMRVVGVTVDGAGVVTLVTADVVVVITLVVAGVVGTMDAAVVLVAAGGCDVVVNAGGVVNGVVLAAVNVVDGVVDAGADEPQPASNVRPARHKKSLFDMRIFFLQLINGRLSYWARPGKSSAL
jgi:hypothetical protein